jgi:hypothetical protein
MVIKKKQIKILFKILKEQTKKLNSKIFYILFIVYKIFMEKRNFKAINKINFTL